MTLEEKRKFFRTLKECGIMTEYIREAKANKLSHSTMHGAYNNNFKKFFEGVSYKYVVDCSFLWDCTRLGRKFWERFNTIFTANISFVEKKAFLFNLKNK